jgi:replicative DNA helicase
MQIVDRVAPQHPEIEKAVVGEMMLDNDCIEGVRELLNSESFYRNEYRTIFRAICALSDRDEPADQVTVMEEVIRMGKLETVGGAAAIAAPVGEVATAVNANFHAKYIRNAWIRRCMINSMTRLIELCYDPAVDVNELLRSSSEVTSGLERAGGEYATLGQAAEIAMVDILAARANPGQLSGLPTGIPKLDNLLNGIQKGDSVVLAGRPSMGKTQTAMFFARHAAAVEPVLIVSREMAAKQLATREIAREARVNSQGMRRGYLDNDEWEKVERAEQDLHGCEIYIDDTARTIDDVESTVREAKRKFDVGMVVVDYLQLVDDSPGSRPNNTNDAVAVKSNRLKDLAKSQNIAVLVLCQLSRACESRADKRPMLSDLRDSGSIEQDADVVMFLYRAEVYGESEPGSECKMEILVSKQRQGPIGMVPCFFEAATGTIGEWTPRTE